MKDLLPEAIWISHFESQTVICSITKSLCGNSICNSSDCESYTIYKQYNYIFGTAVLANSATCIKMR
jgi:hypothetical protein